MSVFEQHNKLTMQEVVKYVFHGLPFSNKYIDSPWSSIVTPIFPFGFTFLCALGWFLGKVILWIYVFSSESTFVRFFSISDILVSPLVAGIFYAIFNLILFLWCLLVLSLARFKFVFIQPFDSAKRVTYFASIFQPIIPFAWGIIGTKPQVFPDSIFITFCAIIILTALFRMLMVFQCVRLDTGFVRIGLIGVIGCIDSLFILGLTVFLVLYDS
jgi:hypothetical protein